MARRRKSKSRKSWPNSVRGMWHLCSNGELVRYILHRNGSTTIYGVPTVELLRKLEKLQAPRLARTLSGKKNPKRDGSPTRGERKAARRGDRSASARSGSGAKLSYEVATFTVGGILEDEGLSSRAKDKKLLALANRYGFSSTDAFLSAAAKRMRAGG